MDTLLKKEAKMPPKPLAASSQGSSPGLRRHLAATFCNSENSNEINNLRDFVAGGIYGAKLAGTCRQAATPLQGGGNWREPGGEHVILLKKEAVLMVGFVHVSGH